MKKGLAITLLVICNALVVFVMSIVNLFVWGLTLSLAAAILVGLAVLTALGFASSRVFRVFKRKYGLRTRWFALASYAPSLIGAAVYWIIYLILDSNGYFTGYFAGLSEGLFGISLAPTALCYLISGTAWCCGQKQGTTE